ncbi:MAG: FAD-dependent oxidoreductase [Casimicrobium sp.]
MTRSTVVIGAGVVGCASAYLLAKAGHRVHLIDYAATHAAGTSHANGAQLSYSFVEPLATPSILRKIPGIVFGRDPALRLHPRMSLAQWRWGARFLLSCRESVVDESTRALLQLAHASRVEIQGLLDAGLNFGHARTGKLVLLDSVAALGRARDTICLQCRYGADQVLLSRDETIAKEPSLSRSAAQIAGAIWSEADELCDPKRFCDALIEAAREEGLATSFDCGAIGFRVIGRRVVGVSTALGDIEANTVVVANGMGATPLLRTIGIRVPIQPIKGYSITLPADAVAHMPQRSITDLARKIVYAPLGDRLRVAGFAELSAHDTIAHDECARALFNATRERFGCVQTIDEMQRWAGLRPATPDSRPIVGGSKYENLFLNVGHGALGLTLAMGSARLIEQMVTARLGKPPAPGQTAFVVS